MDQEAQDISGENFNYYNLWKYLEIIWDLGSRVHQNNHILQLKLA